MQIDLMRLQKSVKQWSSEREQLSKKIRQAHNSIRDISVFDNISLYDRMLKLPDLYDKSNHTEFVATLQAMLESCNKSVFYDLDKSDLEQIRDYKGAPPPLYFPPEFKLFKTYIHRGLPVVVGAEPGIGKTTFAINMMINAVIDKHHSLFFSMEMTKVQVWCKLYQVYKKKYLNERITFTSVLEIIRKGDELIEWPKIQEFVKDYQKYIHIIDLDELSAGQMVAIYEHCADKIGKNPEFVFIDYVQLVSPEQSIMRSTIREQVMATSRILKSKSKRTGSVFIELSQVDDKGRTNESRELEKNAGMKVILERDIDDDTGEMSDTVKIRVKKNRFGKVTMSEVKFDGETGSIGEVE